MDKPENEQALADMTDEEREEYRRKQKIFENAANNLQGAIAFKPEPDPNLRMMGLVAAPNSPFGMGMQQTPPPPKSEWPDGERWKCGCGSVNTGKFCPECGSAAPPRSWNCPNCGHENLGKFCTECATPAPLKKGGWTPYSTML